MIWKQQVFTPHCVYECVCSHWISRLQILRVTGCWTEILAHYLKPTCQMQYTLKISQRWMSEGLQGKSFADKARFFLSIIGRMTSNSIFQDASDVDQYIRSLKQQFCNCCHQRYNLTRWSEIIGVHLTVTMSIDLLWLYIFKEDCIHVYYS